jgi:hypothetical protein
MRRRWWLGGLAMGMLGALATAVTLMLLARDPSPDRVLAEIARTTPLGSTVAEVETSLRANGRAEGMCWTEDRNGTKGSIKVRYIDSLELGVPPERMIIEATWDFDAQGKLAEISLVYYRAGLLSIGYTKINDTPIRLSGNARKR